MTRTIKISALPSKQEIANAVSKLYDLGANTVNWSQGHNGYSLIIGVFK